MCTRRLVAVLAVAALAGCAAARSVEGPNLGQPASPAEIAAWDISIPPDGAGLPAGSGTAARGAVVYAEKCQACHGDKGAGQPNDRLVGGHGTLTSASPVRTGLPIFGPGAAALTREALAQRDRPDFPKRRDVTGVPAAIHWKTGTSFGFRDAWAVGSGPAYTVVVWTGNVDNQPSAELVGSEAAGPLLFDVLEGLASRNSAQLPAPHDDLIDVEVCAYSGHIAGDACPDRVKVHAPVHAVPTTPCPYHQAYDVDRATGRAVVPACRKPGKSYDRKSFVVLPSAVTAWLTDRHRAVPEAPVFDDDCAADAAAAPPVMTTPGEGQVVSLNPGVPASRQLVPLSASTHAAAVTWFVDGVLVGSAAADQRVYWTPAVGRHEIVVADDAGRKARRTLIVERGASQRPR